MYTVTFAGRASQCTCPSPAAPPVYVTSSAISSPSTTKWSTVNAVASGSVSVAEEVISSVSSRVLIAAPDGRTRLALFARTSDEMFGRPAWPDATANVPFETTSRPDIEVSPCAVNV